MQRPTLQLTLRGNKLKRKGSRGLEVFHHLHQASDGTFVLIFCSSFPLFCILLGATRPTLIAMASSISACLIKAPVAFRTAVPAKSSNGKARAFVSNGSINKTSAFMVWVSTALFCVLSSLQNLVPCFISHAFSLSCAHLPLQQPTNNKVRTGDLTTARIRSIRACFIRWRSTSCKI